MIPSRGPDCVLFGYLDSIVKKLKKESFAKKIDFEPFLGEKDGREALNAYSLSPCERIYARIGSTEPKKLEKLKVESGARNPVLEAEGASNYSSVFKSLMIGAKESSQNQLNFAYRRKRQNQLKTQIEAKSRQKRAQRLDSRHHANGLSSFEVAYSHLLLNSSLRSQKTKITKFPKNENSEASVVHRSHREGVSEGKNAKYSQSDRFTGKFGRKLFGSEKKKIFDLGQKESINQAQRHPLPRNFSSGGVYKLKVASRRKKSKKHIFGQNDSLERVQSTPRQLNDSSSVHQAWKDGSKQHYFTRSQEKPKFLQNRFQGSERAPVSDKDINNPARSVYKQVLPEYHQKGSNRRSKEKKLKSSQSQPNRLKSAKRAKPRVSGGSGHKSRLVFRPKKSKSKNLKEILKSKFLEDNINLRSLGASINPLSSRTSHKNDPFQRYSQILGGKGSAQKLHPASKLSQMRLSKALERDQESIEFKLMHLKHSLDRPSEKRGSAKTKAFGDNLANSTPLREQFLAGSSTFREKLIAENVFLNSLPLTGRTEFQAGKKDSGWIEASAKGLESVAGSALALRSSIDQKSGFLAKKFFGRKMNKKRNFGSSGKLISAKDSRLGSKKAGASWKWPEKHSKSKISLKSNKRVRSRNSNSRQNSRASATGANPNSSKIILAKQRERDSARKMKKFFFQKNAVKFEAHLRQIRQRKHPGFQNTNQKAQNIQKGPEKDRKSSRRKYNFLGRKGQVKPSTQPRGGSVKRVRSFRGGGSRKLQTGSEIAIGGSVRRAPSEGALKDRIMRKLRQPKAGLGQDGSSLGGGGNGGSVVRMGSSGGLKLGKGVDKKKQFFFKIFSRVLNST